MALWDGKLYDITCASCGERVAHRRELRPRIGEVIAAPHASNDGVPLAELVEVGSKREYQLKCPKCGQRTCFEP